jgi:ribonuclease T1
MAIRRRIVWGPRSPLDDPRLRDLDLTVAKIRMNGPLPAGTRRAARYENREGHLPDKPRGYWQEYYLTPRGPDGRDELRLVLGRCGEVYVSGNHYRDLRQIINMPDRRGELAGRRRR